MLFSCLPRLLLPACFVYLASCQVVTQNGCFQVLNNCACGNCGGPYQITTAATVQDCLDQCQADTRCVGVRFCQTCNGLANCRMFNVIPGTQNPFFSFFNQFGTAGVLNRRTGVVGALAVTGSPIVLAPLIGNGIQGVVRGSAFRDPINEDIESLFQPANKTILEEFWDQPRNGNVVTLEGHGVLILPEERPPIKGSPLSLEDIKRVVEYSRTDNETVDLAFPIQRQGIIGQPFFFQSNGNQLFVWTGACARPTIATAAPALTLTTVRLRPTTPATRPTPPLPARVMCGSGQEAKYLRLENTELAGLDDFVFQAQTVQQCIMACTNNLLPDGSQAACSSFDYDRITNTCAMSLETLPPTGTGVRSQAEGKDYYEKVCLPGSLVEGCSDVLEQLPNTILVGFARAVTTEASYADCIQSCLNAETLFGFKCLSGQYFYDGQTENCVLNEESKDTQPGLINVVDNERVTYFDFSCRNRRSRLGSGNSPGPVGNILDIGRDTWGPWSYCNRKTFKLSRYRNCRSYNPISCDSQTVHCSQRDAKIP